MKAFVVHSTFVSLLAWITLTFALPQAGSSTVTAKARAATSTARSNTAAKAAGKLYFGSATDNPFLDEDATYKAILSDNTLFGQLSPENAMKWDATEPEQGVFTFTNGDVIVALAQANGQIMRGHNTVWGSQLPSWVSDSGFDNATLISVMQNHVSTVIGHYKGQIQLGCCQWYNACSIIHLFAQLTVYAEPFNDDGTLASNVFFETIGPTYIDLALQAARAADPDAKLYINDFNIEGEGVKATAMANLVSDLKSRGIPIDGIGLESHFILGEIPTTLQAQMEAFTALGVEVAVTELDIRMTLPETDALLAQQQTDFQNVVSACTAVADCVGVTVWEYTDKYSWVPSTFAGQGDADPWDENLEMKPAYDGIIAGFSS
ncbi:endo-beta-1,4-glucanase [Lentinula detonsa]|uniref:Beta-xylanase n=1 Tax=Lentinula detonsa TaxID=2804962 RepID=A0AA38UQR0_9AGAR|nr:endo-beta-1,4-glucanase [Lentinula detonsa]